MGKEEYVEHYRERIREYFADTTVEGRIAKYAKMRECEWTLAHVFSMTPRDRQKIYEEEYRKSLRRAD